MASVSVQHSLVLESSGLVQTATNGMPNRLLEREANFSAIYASYQRRLVRVAWRILKNDADAEDVVQDSLMRAYTNMDGFRGEAAIYTWLVRIVINTSLMVIRKRTRHPLASLDVELYDKESFADLLVAPGVSAETSAIGQQLTDMVYAAVTDLSPEFRPLMLAWMAQEQPLSELSLRFGLTLPATKSRILRGKQKVRKTLRRRLKLNTDFADESERSHVHNARYGTAVAR